MAIRHSIGTLPPFPTVEGIEIRHIPNAGGYAIGSDGSFWSCRQSFPPYGFGKKWMLRKQKEAWNGYMRVNLWSKGICKTVFVHHLVLESFVGARPEGTIGLHWPDSNPKRNEASNLRWGTPADNYADSVVHGTCAKGSRHGAAKLSEADVRQILLLLSNGMMSTAIAKLFNVSLSTISCIDLGKTWKNVPRNLEEQTWTMTPCEF